MGENNTANVAIKIVTEWFKQMYGNNPAYNPHKKGKGFDLQSPDGTIIIEVKGSERTKLSEVQFRVLTDDEFKEAQSCKRQGKEYQLHLVAGINVEKGTYTNHYMVLVDYVLQNSKSKTIYELPLGEKSVTQAIKQNLIKRIEHAD